MAKILLALLDFRSPYHVGWRTVEPVIEGFTVHRALVYASSVTEGASARELSGLRVSAALPTARSSGCSKLLLPLPPIPSRVGTKKMGLGWITARAAYIISTLASGGLPYIRSVTGERPGELVVEADGTSVKLCYDNEVVRGCEEDLDVSTKVLERVEIFLNRMDRVTSAAEVYRVSGYRPWVKFGVVLQGDDEVVDRGMRLLKVLGELGVGGMRSRGFGRFSVEPGELCDAELLSERRGPDHVVLLGSYVFNELVDTSRSIVVKKLVEGTSGPPQDSYVLPCLSYIGAGSVVRATGELRPEVISVGGSRLGALMIFNPVALGGPR